MKLILLLSTYRKLPMYQNGRYVFSAHEVPGGVVKLMRPFLYPFRETTHLHLAVSDESVITDIDNWQY